MELQVGVKAFIKNNSGKYLFLKRREKLIDDQEPSWTIPGGRIDPSEGIFDGLAREVKEETGLTLQGTPQILCAQDIFRPHLKRHIVRLTFEAVAKGTVDIGHDEEKDHEKYRWMSLKDLENEPMEKMLLPVIEFLKNKSSKK